MEMAKWRSISIAAVLLAASAGAGVLRAQVPAGEKPKAEAPPATPATPAVPEPGKEPAQKPLAGGFDDLYLKNVDSKPVENQEYITLIVKDKDLGEVLRFIGRQVGVNIIPDPEVKEKVTV